MLLMCDSESKATTTENTLS